jgi:phospholipase/carboxylesterase
MSRISIVWVACICVFVLSSCKGQTEKPIFEYEIRPTTAAPGKDQKMLILLHGLGSNEQDLFSLAQYIPAEYTVISARAPYSHNGSGYAWYAVDFSSGKAVGNIEQTEKSRQDLVTFISQVSDKYSIKKENIVLAGFSQGAIMSYAVAISSPSVVNKIGCFGGRILEQTKSSISSSIDLKNLHCFVAHGTQDQMISINEARNAKTFLTTHKVDLSYHEYNDGHTINGDMLNDFINWLETSK